MLAVSAVNGEFQLRPPLTLIGAVLLLNIFAIPLWGASVTTDKTSYLVLQPVSVTYSGLPGNARDWISIGPAADPDGSGSLHWVYTNGKTSGTVTFDPVQSPGNYQARVYYDNGTAVQARTSFTVSYPTPQISTDKPSYFVLQPIIVTYSNMPGYPKDYITIVPAGSPDNTYNQYIFTNGAKSGTMTFNDVPAGSYEVRVHFNNDDSTVRARLPFTVSYPVPQMTTDKSSYMVREKIIVTYSNLPGYSKDYITVVPAGSADSVYAQWFFTNGARSGTMTFDPVPAGKYEARLHFNNEDAVRARVAFTVGNPLPQVSTDKTSYLVLQKIVVTYSGMPGYANDFITLVPDGSKDNAIGPYFYTNGAKNGTMTFADQPPGSYEVRVHFNDDNNVVYARASFNVSYPDPRISTSLSTYLVLDKITVNYSNLPGYQKDFVTVVPASAPDNAVGQYFYTSGKPSGSMTFDDLAPGNYQARVHFNDDNNAVYARASFNVIYPNTMVSTGKTQYQEKESIVVNYSGMPGYTKDYITVVPASAPDNAYHQYIFTGGANSGTMTFEPVPAGRWEARVHYNNDDTTVRTRSGFTVVSDCSISISPGSLTIPAAAYNGSIAVTVTPDSSVCPWQASTTSSWMTITSGSSGTASGVVNYHATANTGSNSRTDTLTIAGQTFTLTQNPPSQIQITSIANAASLIPSVMPSGGIAQGAIFSIKGSALGPGDPADPATGVSASMPLATSLGNVSVQVKQGDTVVHAYPLFAWTGRIDAIMPSAMPLGAVTITVAYNGILSEPAPVTVVASNFGAYATNGQSGGRGVLLVHSSSSDPGVQNSNTQTARPGQMVTLVGTGLGSINVPDDVEAPAGDLPVMPQLSVLVGGKPAPAVHASRVPHQPGKDQIQFLVPLDAPAGCNTPLQVVTGTATYSNMVTMAIDPEGKACSTLNPWSGVTDQGGRFGNIFLLRLQASVALAADEPPMDLLMDAGIAAFTNESTGGGPILSLLASIPSLGTCGALGGSLNLGSLLGSPSSAAGMQAVQYLDAGPSLSISGPNGAQELLPDTNDDGTPVIPGMYSGTLGGGLDALFGGTPAPPYLDAGAYTISGTGGKDIGPFSANLTIPPPITWTNKDETAAIDRSTGVTFSWSGGSDSQLVLAAGLTSDPTTNATSGFVCFAPSSQGSLSVPVPVLANISPTGTNGSLGAVMLGTVPAGAGTTFKAGGLDAGLAFYGSFSLRTVEVK